MSSFSTLIGTDSWLLSALACTIRDACMAFCSWHCFASRHARRHGKPATDGSSSSSGGNPPGNAYNTGGGFIPPARPALPTGWREFKHPDGAFSIFVPAQPKHAPMSMPSLKLNQRLGPNEARETHHCILPSAKQPYLIEMKVMLLDAALQSTLEQSYAMNRPKDDINHKWKEFREVTWAGRRATESALEKTFFQSDNAPPKRYHQVARHPFTWPPLHLRH